MLGENKLKPNAIPTKTWEKHLADMHTTSLRTNSVTSIRDLQNHVMPDLMLVTGPQHTGLLGLWKILISFFVYISLNMLNWVKIAHFGLIL